MSEDMKRHWFKRFRILRFLIDNIEKWSQDFRRWFWRHGLCLQKFMVFILLCFALPMRLVKHHFGEGDKCDGLRCKDSNEIERLFLRQFSFTARYALPGKYTSHLVELVAASVHSSREAGLCKHHKHFSSLLAWKIRKKNFFVESLTKLEWWVLYNYFWTGRLQEW